MTIRVTVTLPDTTYHRAEELARLTGRTIDDILAETIDISLQPLGSLPQGGEPMSALPDADVLAIAESRMEPDQDRRFGVLLDKQQAGTLTDDERSDLLALMQVYQAGLLRKAQALREAVRRGLREPLEP